MDRLPYPEDAVLPPLRVPFICGDVERYDGKGLRDFPSRRTGWTESSPLSQWSLQDTARAQSWLYFGLLEELFGQSFNRNAFVEVSANGQQHITTHKLPALLKWFCQETSQIYKFMTSFGFIDISDKGFLRGRPRLRLDGRLTDALKLAEEQSNALDTGGPLSCLIALSIKVLIWSVSNALNTYLPSREKTKGFSPRQSRLLKQRMLEGGKCPYWTEVYQRTYSVAMLNYLAASPSVGGTSDHGGCSANQCVAHDIDEEQYTTKHVDDTCQCEMTSPNINKVLDIIQNGGVPLMNLQVLPNELLSLNVVRAKYGLHYTAISHVWSGGLGNPSSNSLPQCQLERIRAGTCRHECSVCNRVYAAFIVPLCRL